MTQLLILPFCTRMHVHLLCVVSFSKQKGISCGMNIAPGENVSVVSSSPPHTQFHPWRMLSNDVLSKSTCALVHDNTIM